MRRLALPLIASLLAACASAPPPAPVESLFHDHLFAKPAVPVDPHAALAVSAPMREYLANHIPASARGDILRRSLVDALYSKGELRLEYDAARTRTAAEAFQARTGNCLALVLMTSAFARELGLPVRYQVALDDDTWDRRQDTYISVGHINLTLDERTLRPSGEYFMSQPLTIDFIPGANAQRMRTRVVLEHSVVASYLNNRAVEQLIEGDLDASYWWTRAALMQDPALMSPYLTLAVIYRNRHRPDLADEVLSRVLDREPANLKAISNRILVLRDLGRSTEAAALSATLARLEPHPPFSYFHEGMAAFLAGRYDMAKDLFSKEVGRAPYHHEFHFWLALTYLQLNDFSRAAAHLTKAAEVSTTRKDHDMYAVKLARLKSLGTH